MKLTNLAILGSIFKQNFNRAINDNPILLSRIKKENFEILKPIKEPNSVVAKYDSFFSSLIMIIISEIGDKTFFIAAFLSMKHPRIKVFLASYSALFIMSVLSSFLGKAFVYLVPIVYIYFLAAILFVFFGLKLLNDGLKMTAEEETNEILDIKEEIELRKDHDLGIKFPCIKYIEQFLKSIFFHAFLLTFIAEWGDRSQFATIALSASKNVYWVCIGSIIGHGICTAAAVIGGKYLAKKISIKKLTLIGSIVFLIFSVMYFTDAIYSLQ